MFVQDVEEVKNFKNPAHIETEREFLEIPSDLDLARAFERGTEFSGFNPLQSEEF